MTLKLSDVLSGNYEVTTLAQGVVVGHLQELASEAGDLAEELDAALARVREIQARMDAHKAIVRRVLNILDDLPDTQDEGAVNPPEFPVT